MELFVDLKVETVEQEVALEKENIIVGGSGTIDIFENGPKNVKPYEFANVQVPLPHGEVELTSNGPADVKDFETALVNVQPNLIPKSITENGTYYAQDDNADGYSSVTVNVPDTAYQLLARTITNIVIPNTIDSVLSYICYANHQLQSVIFEQPSRITNVERSAFDGCLSLRNITLPSGLIRISPIAFRGCSALTNINLPNGLTAIEIEAFRGCGLQKIKFSSTITSIANNAFSYCSSLTQIDCTELTYTGNTPNTTLGINAFYNSTAPIVFADEATMNVYKVATNWSTYASRMTYEGA